ncbi:hypothetical protein PXK01_19175 [Phaeobacter sp. PT47_59]|uniref:hypothetical protein n=1 Tax=Phaeobacter sp. PT47_59 TaxID=3029979 RepID=UPI00238047DE|nr:hypothetical protein [Phaeobacter sp. PT47_59]MDE4176282.1 hypothetical protein [Phaeobacter sp. PT47_59]
MNGLRPASEVMRLSRLGSAHQTRLSFMRVLLRGLRKGGWQVDRPLWDIDAQGVGRAVYRVRGQGQCYSLVAFAHDLPDALRSDRVIAEAWDATFALMDGEVSAADLDRLAANVPRQEAGRVSDRELVLSRANRSTRLWSHVVERLAAGRQPDAERLAEVGYLMRTTAVYGSGKFGAADHTALAGRDLMDGPFRAEMLAVWLIRAFVCDLVEHLARARGGARATTLHPALRRSLGIGNSTGLGMAPFLVNHPALLNAWITARETALARIRALPESTPGTRASFERALGGFARLLTGWHSEHPIQRAKLADLSADLVLLRAHIAKGALEAATPWAKLWDWAMRTLSVEGQELLLSLILEPHGAYVDDLAEQMGAQERKSARIAGAMTVSELNTLIAKQFDWALTPDYTSPEACARFWYVSEAKLEPRLGERHTEPGAEREQPLGIGRAVSELAGALDSRPPGETVAAFLRLQPEHRRAVRRVQMAKSAPYGEIRDNLIAADLLPIDILRCKLAFFGATGFDPRSDRWVRITMYQNAPFPDELHQLPEDDWCLPAAEAEA